MESIMFCLLLVGVLLCVMPVYAANFRVVPSDATVIAGEPHTLHCSIDGEYQKGDPRIYWAWTDPLNRQKFLSVDRTLYSAVDADKRSRYSITGNVVDGDFNLHISSTSADDEGQYRCIMHDKAGGSKRVSARLVVQKSHPPSAGYPKCSITPANPQPGQYAIFSCISAGGIPPATLSWAHDDIPVSGIHRNFTGLQTGAYHRRLMTGWDNNVTFTCSSRVGQTAYSASCSVVPFQIPIHVTIMSPQIVTVGDTAEFFCLATSVPFSIRYRWLVGRGKDIARVTKTKGRFVVGNEGASLHIMNITKEDNEMPVRCVARNPLEMKGIDEDMLRVAVYRPGPHQPTAKPQATVSRDTPQVPVTPIYIPHNPRTPRQYPREPITPRVIPRYPITPRQIPQDPVMPRYKPRNPGTPNTVTPRPAPPNPTTSNWIRTHNVQSNETPQTVHPTEPNKLPIFTSSKPRNSPTIILASRTPVREAPTKKQDTTTVKLSPDSVLQPGPNESGGGFTAGAVVGFSVLIVVVLLLIGLLIKIKVIEKKEKPVIKKNLRLNNRGRIDKLDIVVVPNSVEEDKRDLREAHQTTAGVIQTGKHRHGSIKSLKVPRRQSFVHPDFLEQLASTIRSKSHCSSMFKRSSFSWKKRKPSTATQNQDQAAVTTDESHPVEVTSTVKRYSAFFNAVPPTTFDRDEISTPSPRKIRPTESVYENTEIGLKLQEGAEKRNSESIYENTMCLRRDVPPSHDPEKRASEACSLLNLVYADLDWTGFPSKKDDVNDTEDKTEYAQIRLSQAM